MNNFIYQDTDVSNTVDKVSYEQHYSEAKRLEKEGTLESLESALGHIAAAINNLNKKKEITHDKSFDTWLVKFTEHQLLIKINYHEKRIKTLLEAVKKKEVKNNLREMVNLYKKIRDSMNFLYQSGHENIEIEEINKIKSKISEFTKKILSKDLSVPPNNKLDQKIEILEQKPDNTKTNKSNVKFELVELNDDFEEDDNGKIQSSQYDLNEVKVTSNQQENNDVLINIEDDEPEITDNPPEKRKILDEIIITSAKQEGIITKASEDDLKNEIISGESLNITFGQIEKTLKFHNYTLLYFREELQKLYKLIDFFAIKIIEVNDFLDVCQIIPVKLSNLYGTLIVSEKSVKYNSVNKDLTAFERENIVDSILLKIKRIYNIIEEDLRKQGPVTENIIGYIDNGNIKLERKKLSGKKFFYRNGPMLYKFQVQPVVVSHNKVGFLEKNIPYAYQLKDNIYYVNTHDFSDLLEYLERKKLTIERICVKKQPMNCYVDNRIKLSNNLMILGIVLGVFGFSYLLLLILNNETFLNVLSFLQYPFVAGICVICITLFYKYNRNQKEVYSKFQKDFGAGHPDFSEKNLNLAINQIDPSEREQFLYEIYSKKVIPENLTKKILKTDLSMNISELFEKDEVNVSISQLNLSRLKEVYKSYIQKQNYFKAYCILRAILVIKLRDILCSRFEKPIEIIESINDIFKLLNIIEAEKVYELNKSYEKKLLYAEKLRRKGINLDRQGFESINTIILDIIDNIRKNLSMEEYSIYRNNLIPESSQENTVFEKKLETNSGKFEDFLEDE